jgi:hypothetical protein
MLARKLTLCAGAGLLFALAKPVVSSWTATLSPLGGSNVSGTARVDVPDTGMTKPYQAPPAGAYDSTKKPEPTPTPGATDSSHKKAALGNPSEATQASIEITGAKEGEYPWHVHTGKCGASGPPVGGESAYTPIKVSADGKGTATANISEKLTAGSDYSVNVHKSKSDKSVISCGELRSGGEPMQNMPPRDTTAPKP